MSKLVSTNPAKNYEVIGEVEVSTEEEVRNAVSLARKAVKDWRAKDVKGRVAYFQKFLKLFDTHADELAELQSREMGKTIGESKDDIVDARNLVTWLIENAEKHLAPEVLDETDEERTESDTTGQAGGLLSGVA